ncbi:Receptor-like protein kinase [Actinidia chinensis var. chinensis]|uniref:non-specific serine/threonine protein kinase n=1 Tax=Actinidia chinensis var. chinensis TaxID=1590841 RepID=A0A2R6QXG3_ACTCC|nr:Receptor-like protein kinase [Actinidia chinensis var. chinensis]
METTMLALALLLFLSLPPPSHQLNQEGLYLQRVKLGLSDPSGYLSDWNDRDDTPCGWTGITCDSLSRSVNSIDLTNASLAGPFPIFLCRLPSLAFISLYNNNLNSSLPLSISNCRNLRSLNLAENLLEGPIPYTLAEIPNLTHLILQANSFSGVIPASFALFRRLQTLNLVSNFLNGTIPAFLSNLTSLKSLALAYNPFNPSRLAPELGNLTNLETLWLTHCNLEGSIPESFGQLSRLIDLDVSNNMMSGTIPTVIFRLKNIVQIEFYNNSFSGEFPAGWSNLTELRRFDASMNELDGTIPNELCELPLESLNLCDNKLVGLLPESIALSPNLNELKVFNNSLHGSLPSQLGKNSPLQIFDVSSNQFSGEIPASLCDKGVLEQLLLIHNSFSGTIPASLGKCKTLNRVRFRNNRFSGEVPAEFWSLPHVDLLDLGENSFSGSISYKISGASNLSVLYISKNRFSGTIPKEIGSIANLVEISASDNELSGQIPSTIGNLDQLGRLVLRNNKLSGNIPMGIGSLKQLNELNLANNGLSGQIPDDIGSLPVLNYLDLSENQFSGKIPLGLQNLKLNVLNLSYNRLSGDIPPLYAKDQYRDSFLGNPGLCGDIPSLCTGKNSVKNQGYLWLLSFLFILAGIVFVVGVVWFGWKFLNFRKTKKGITMLKWRSFHKLGFSEFEILDCIDEDTVIGSGSSGKIYKAVLSNGEVVAVKKLCERSKTDDESFTNVSSGKDAFEVEVETLGKIRHKNIVRLWCCCNAGDCKFLVYEYMPNGSLGDLLHSSKSDLLDWPTRLSIALDAAEGLSYLHHGCVPPIVHRDVKSNNILLDAEFGARISDFGVAKIVKTVNRGAEPMSAIAGSCGYIAPEYAYTLRVNEKSDIYSFGVVIFELVTGRRPIDPEFGEKGLVTWVCNGLDQKGIDHVIDPNLDSAFKEQISKVLDIGLLCVSSLPLHRPSMRRVVKMLQEARAGTRTRRATKDGEVSPHCCEDPLMKEV